MTESKTKKNRASTPASTKTKKVYTDTVGCLKNFADTEDAAARLSDAGYVLTDDPQEADFILVNTCGFIEDAKKESIEHIFQMNDLRKPGAKLLLSGCLVQRYANELFKEIPEADGFIGVNSYAHLPSILQKLEGEERFFETAEAPQEFAPEKRHFDEMPYSATLRIAEGCDNRCTYCIIPKIRGAYRSKPKEAVLQEARTLARAGCRELILIAQNLTDYGIDLPGKPHLAELLQDLCRIEGIAWIRLLYCYDEGITDELISVMAREEKICPYIDIPLQHISARVLKRMNRRSSPDSIRRTLEKLRHEIPDIHIRTTMMVGFPGETEEDFAELMAFAREQKFERLGAFAYSREENTPAYAMPDQVPERVKQDRLDALMQQQMEIARAHNAAMIGKTLAVLVEGREEDGAFRGRSIYDAPDIDETVIFTSDLPLEKGRIVQVKITDAFDYDLAGVSVAE